MKKTVKDIDVSGKRVLVRVDFNVPLDTQGSVEDDTRIRACLPTISYLIEHHARVILCSHLGRPKGAVDEHLRLAPVARRLSELLERPVISLREVTGIGVEEKVSAMHDGDVLLLENLRFAPGEEENDPAFARDLSRLADIYVNDAFGASHRAHASVVGVAVFLPAVAGLLMEKEITVLGSLLESPRSPFAAVLGGAKVSDKIGVLENILPKVNAVLLGGEMAAAFLAGEGIGVGGSPVDPMVREQARIITEKAASRGVRIILPLDVVIARETRADPLARTVPVQQVPENCVIVDIGPLTIAEFTRELRLCRTVIWNGPLGLFEIGQYAGGTRAIATVLANLNATTVVGGGSTAEVVTLLGLSGRMSHVSTGGGASLQFLAGKTLPGLAVIPDR